MGKILAIVFGTCVVAYASIFLFPVLLAIGLLALLFFGFLAGTELAVVLIAAIAVSVAAAVFLHVLASLLVPVLAICGIVYIVKQFGKTPA